MKFILVTFLLLGIISGCTGNTIKGNVENSAITSGNISLDADISLNGKRKSKEAL